MSAPYFLNFFLPNPASPIKPVPNKSMVAGSGTGATTALPLSFPQFMVKFEAIAVSKSLKPITAKSI